MIAYFNMFNITNAYQLFIAHITKAGTCNYCVHVHVALYIPYLHKLYHDMIFAEEKEEYDITGRDAYLTTCESLGIIPASYFVRKIQEKETNISLSHHGVGPKGAKAISVALTVRTQYN